MVDYWNVGHQILSLVQTSKALRTVFAWVGKVDLGKVPQPEALHNQRVYAFSLTETGDHTVKKMCLAKDTNFYDLVVSPSGRFLGILSHNEVKVFHLKSRLWEGNLPERKPKELTIELSIPGARLIFGPERDCLTVGHCQGRFTRYRLEMKKDVRFACSRIHSVHWFPTEIQSMAYLEDDNSLLICGMHFVAAIYKLDTNTFRFVSGVGAGIRQLLVTEDQRNLVFVLNTGSIHFVSPQQFTSRAAIHGLRVSPEIPKTAFALTSPPRLVVHPSTQYVMLNTIFSSLQLYDPMTDEGISEVALDTMSVNTGDAALNREPGKIWSVAFSGDGSWMAVFVVYQAQTSVIESQLQFWRYDRPSQSFLGPNTRIRVGDGEPITQVVFQPVHSRTIQGNFQAPFVATTSVSGDIKLWECRSREHSSRSNPKKSNVINFWVQRSILSFEGKGTPLLAFSSDGSVLAAVYQSIVTLWDPYTCNLQRCLSRFPMLEIIQSAQFAGPTPYLVTHSATKVTVWSLLTSKVWWEVSCTPRLVAVHPNAGLFAVLDQGDQQGPITIKVYHVSRPVPLSINEVSDKLQSLVFITRRLAHPTEHGLATHQEIYPVQHTPSDPRVVQGDMVVDHTTLAQSSLVGLTELGNVVVYAYPTKDKPLAYHPSMILFKRLDGKLDTGDRKRAASTLYFEKEAQQVTPTKALLDSLYGDLRFRHVKPSNRLETQSRFLAQQRLLKQNAMLDTPVHLLPGVGEMFKTMVTHALLPTQSTPSPSASQQTSAGLQRNGNHTVQPMDTDGIPTVKSLVHAKQPISTVTTEEVAAQSASNSSAELFMWPSSDKIKANVTNTPAKSTLNTESLANYFALLLSH
ncbi:WD repeat-containing protein 75 [Dispira simplex]|nr:WD repeat-containing protein 75 [Dispira simplex]